MRIHKEIYLEEFEAWSGGESTMDTLKELTLVSGYENIFDTLESILEEISDDWDETSLNDCLWFENDNIAEWLGFNDWEELEDKANGEEEEIEIVFEVGDTVWHDGREATIIEVDENDKALPCCVEYEDGEEEWLEAGDVESVTALTH